MEKLTEVQIIAQLRHLKEIKPNKEWASLLKSTLLESKVPGRMTGAVPVQRATFMDTVRFVFTPRKLVYSFAVILFMVVGISVFENLPQKSAVAPAKQTAVIIKNQISATAKTLVQNLKENPAQDSQTIKTLAKTLADMPGDVAATQDVKDLVQAVVQAEIADLQKTTLTETQQYILTNAQKLYDQGKYTDALELLMVNN